MTGRILVAEDSRTQGAALRAHLEQAGFTVTLVRDGADALSQFDPDVHDLVVTDIVMPGVDGYELCRRIKAIDPHRPVLLLTSMTEPLDVIHALSAGADNFLRKPYEPVDLIHRVRNVLHNKLLRDHGRAQMGLELFFLGQRFLITSDRQQILDLLVSTFEELVAVNERLRIRETEAAGPDMVLKTSLRPETERPDALTAASAAVGDGLSVPPVQAV